MQQQKGMLEFISISITMCLPLLSVLPSTPLDYRLPAVYTISLILDAPKETCLKSQQWLTRLVSYLTLHIHYTIAECITAMWVDSRL